MTTTTTTSASTSTTIYRTCICVMLSTNDLSMPSKTALRGSAASHNPFSIHKGMGRGLWANSLTIP
jgi:hypothetical protein